MQAAVKDYEEAKSKMKIRIQDLLSTFKAARRFELNAVAEGPKLPHEQPSKTAVAHRSSSALLL